MRARGIALVDVFRRYLICVGPSVLRDVQAGSMLEVELDPQLYYYVRRRFRLDIDRVKELIDGGE